MLRCIYQGFLESGHDCVLVRIWIRITGVIRLSVITVRSKYTNGEIDSD